MNVMMTCPLCGSAPADAVALTPSIRGYLIPHRFTRKRCIGCHRCVRKELLAETGRALLFGWFSPVALVLNPFLIFYNGIRAPFVGRNPAAVQSILAQLELDGSNRDGTRVATALAATMVAADGEINEDEVTVAIKLGQSLFQDDFDQALFHRLLEKVSQLPTTIQLSGLLGPHLEQEARQSVVDYLLAIAAADGYIDQTEIVELEEAARGLGVTPPVVRAGPVTQDEFITTDLP